LAQGWTSAQFDVVGEGNGSEAMFNDSNAELVVQDDVTNADGQPGSPQCGLVGDTGETNNLTLVPNSCCTVSGTGSLVFTEGRGTGLTPLLCTNTPEDNYFRLNTCSIPSSGGFNTPPNVSVVKGGNVYLGEGFQPAEGEPTVTSWTNLGAGASPPASHPESANVLDSAGNFNLAVVYVGADHKIYERHQVSGGAFSAWSSATYAGLSAYSAPAVIGATDPANGYLSTSMLIVALDSAHHLNALLSNGQAAISGWSTSPGRTLLGAPSGYVDSLNNFYVVGVDATTKQAYETRYIPGRGFQGWSPEDGVTTFGTGVAASFAIDGYTAESTWDYPIKIVGNAADLTTPWLENFDWSTNAHSASSLVGTFDSAPSVGNSLGCSQGGCGYQPILTIHAQDGSCYWHDATNLSGEWTLLGHP
jgi:hypothetical protein